MLLTGSSAVAPDAGDWVLRHGVLDAAASILVAGVAEHHEQSPLREGMPVAAARRLLNDALRPATGPPDRGLLDAVLDRLAADGRLVRTSDAIALPVHRPADRATDPRVLAVVDALSHTPAAPPTVKELVASGIGRDAIDAATRAGLVVRVAPDLVFTSEAIARARAIVSEAGDAGITVSAFR
jgi:selenocysteine-specific elongation factor